MANLELSHAIFSVSELKKDFSTIDVVPIRAFSEFLAILVAFVHKKPNAVQKLLYLIGLK